MPTIHKTGQALFLGLELATEQVRATIVDESLELVGVESVDFDSELPEYQTHGGIFTTPGDAYTTPVEMWIKGLDLLLEKLVKNYEVGKIRSIGGAAQHALVWWKSTTLPALSSLDPRAPFHTHFPAQSFSLPVVPTVQDISSHTHALAIEALLGGPEHMVNRVGTAASASLIAAQLLRVRESWPQEVWARTGRVQLASAFLGSLISGKWMSMGEAEACATGMWVHGANPSSINAGQPNQLGYWDEGVLDIVGGSREEGRRVRGWLGEVDTSGGGRRVGNVSRYLVERFGFDTDAIVASFTSDSLSSYLSLLPFQNDAVLSFGPMDTLMTPAQLYIPTRLYNLVPHPAQDPGEKRKYIAMLTSRNADIPRTLVRDLYTKSWSAFDRLVAIVPPGGSIGLDDKLFSFYYLQSDSYPHSHVKGIYRFETGIKVTEFRDLRANPRCLVESQILAFRVKWSRMLATGVLGTPRKSPNPTSSSSPAPQSQSQARASANMLSSLGVTFDPYDPSPLPSRILTTGSAANFPSVANLVGDVFNSPVFVPTSQVDAAQIDPHRISPARGFPARAALGASFVARWVWTRDRDGSAGVGLLGFEEEGRRVLGRRWVATNGIPLRTNVGGAVPLPQVATNSLSISGSSFGNSFGGVSAGRAGLGLSSTVFAEEEEDAELERERREQELQERASLEMGTPPIGVIGGMYGGASTFGTGSTPTDLGFNNPRLRTQTGSTVDSLGNLTSASVVSGTSTTFTTPDSNLLATGGGGTGAGSTNGAGSLPTSTPTPLTPVAAMPTADLEAQLGLAKVAEPDVDAFMTYAAIVPEYCRLEGMLIKRIV